LLLEGPKPSPDLGRDLALGLAETEHLEGRHEEEALADLPGRPPQDHHILVRSDTDEAIRLQTAQRLHDRDAADARRRGHGGGHDALAGSEAPLDDGVAKILIGRFLEGLMLGEGREEPVAARRRRALFRQRMRGGRLPCPHGRLYTIYD